MMAIHEAAGAFVNSIARGIGNILSSNDMGAGYKVSPSMSNV